MIPQVDNLLLARRGPMTNELVRQPGSFGLGQVPVRRTPAATVESICGFCATGCRLRIHVDESGSAINVSPDVDYPVNLGMACPKGWEALTPLAATDRATTPLLRNPETGKLEPVEWTEALDVFVDRFKRIGPRRVAFLSTGQIPTEEMALLGALFKFGMGGVHCDSNTRQCMATAHVAYKESFGFDAPPYTYADFEQGDVLFFVGANPAIAHPILWQRVLRNPNRPRIIVVDPRRTETAMCADDHVALRPRSDLWLLYGIAHELIAKGWVDHTFVDAHTSGGAEFAAFIESYSPEVCSEATGVPAAEIRSLAAVIGKGQAVSFWWTMGVNQGHESTRTAQAIINLALLTGNIGRPGTGANSITGQCNAMGSRLFGNATSLFAGRSFQNASDRADVARILDIPVASIPTESSLAYDQILDAIETGEIRGLWVIATNPAHSWIHRGRFEKLRQKLDFLVVQDMYHSTDTARIADLVLPAAGWGEKEGTFINSERRLGVIRRVARAPGRALSDFAIFKLIAEAWGCGDMFRRWSSPAAVFEVLKELSRGRPCDISGVDDYDHIDRAGGIQWPFAERDPLPMENGACRTTIGSCDVSPEQTSRERRLFEDGRFFTTNGRARFVFDPPRETPERPDREFPFWLNTGRGSSAQWHTCTRTAKSDVLTKLAPNAPYVEINPEDAELLAVEDGESVRLASRRGTMEAMAFVTPIVSPGQVFIPMHYPAVNRLTLANFDPHSRQPGYKACAVRVEKRMEDV